MSIFCTFSLVTSLPCNLPCPGRSYSSCSYHWHPSNMRSLLLPAMILIIILKEIGYLISIWIHPLKLLSPPFSLHWSCGSQIHKWSQWERAPSKINQSLPCCVNKLMWTVTTSVPLSKSRKPWQQDGRCSSEWLPPAQSQS